MTTSTETTHRNPITCTHRNTIICRLQRKKRHNFYKEERNARDVGLAGSAGNGPAGGGRAGGVESLAAAVEEEGVELGGEPLAGVLVDGSAHAAGAEKHQHRRRRQRQQWWSKGGAAAATAVGAGGHDRMWGRFNGVGVKGAGLGRKD